MGQRLQLHEILKEILGTDNVYFQPPANVQMVFPAIVYKRDDADTQFADNVPYRVTQRYQVTVISRDPDNAIRPKVAELPSCLYVRGFAASNLNHDVFVLYF